MIKGRYWQCEICGVFRPIPWPGQRNINIGVVYLRGGGGDNQGERRILCYRCSTRVEQALSRGLVNPVGLSNDQFLQQILTAIPLLTREKLA